MTRRPSSDSSPTISDRPLFISVETAEDVVRVLNRVRRDCLPRTTAEFRVHKDVEILLAMLVKETQR